MAIIQSATASIPVLRFRKPLAPMRLKPQAAKFPSDFGKYVACLLDMPKNRCKSEPALDAEPSMPLRKDGVVSNEAWIRTLDWPGSD